MNPFSGRGATAEVARDRVAFLSRGFAAAGVAGSIHLTERPHHARDLARTAVEAGVPIVAAWGGDGTINEVGAALAGSGVVLGVIPAGSGNGFASELGIPHDPAAALAVVLAGRDTLIDAGEMDGRLFFNIAGIGFDAVVAHQFNARPIGRRGMWPYVTIGLREMFRYRGAEYRITLDGESLTSRALLIAFANGREYGNRMCLSSTARMDDGKLEAVVAADRPPLARLWSGRHLALRTLHTAPGMVLRSITSARVEADGEILYHVDGEPGRAFGSIDVRVRRGHLKVRVQQGTRA